MTKITKTTEERYSELVTFLVSNYSNLEIEDWGHSEKGLHERIMMLLREMKQEIITDLTPNQ